MPEEINEEHTSQQESWTLRVLFAVIMAPIFLILGIVMSHDIEAGSPVRWLFVVALLLFGLSDGVHATLMRWTLWRRMVLGLSPSNRKRVGEALLLSFLGAAFMISPDYGPVTSVFVWLAYVPPLFLVFFVASCLFDGMAAFSRRRWQARRG